jgi:hypothetical protein
MKIRQRPYGHKEIIVELEDEPIRDLCPGSDDDNPIADKNAIAIVFVQFVFVD